MKLPVDKRAESVDLLTHPAAHATYDRVDLVAFDAAWLLWAASRNCGLRRCFVHEQKKRYLRNSEILERESFQTSGTAVPSELDNPGTVQKHNATCARN
jgi:hypothetical protein